MNDYLKSLTHKIKSSVFRILYADDCIQAAYQGILGREPDLEGFSTCKKALANSEDLALLLTDMACSEEFRMKNYAAHVPELVHAIYQGLLAREADNSGLNTHTPILKESADLAVILQKFINSDEFSQSRQMKRMEFLPLDLNKIEVDTYATDDQLAACITKIKDAWSHLGITRPHFSVLTDKQFLPENLDRNIDKFWKSGENEASGIERILARHGCSSLATKTCVDYGCGVGRVILCLARRFGRVHGYDISPGHLSSAERRAKEIGVTNVDFHLCSDFYDELQKCDVFYSRIVFQHNPPPIIKLLIEKALRALNPDGVAIFQVPTYSIGYRFNTLEWLNMEHALDMQMHCLPQEQIFKIIAEEQSVLLEVREDNSTGFPDQFISNTFIVRKLDPRTVTRA